MAQRTPLYDWHVARGARMVDFAGWDMPIQYTSITDEHQAVRTSAGLFDISHMGRLVFTGPDALALIQHLWTNDAASMKPGQVRYGLLCNEQGGIRDDVLVYRLEPFWLMVVNASNREKILGWIEQQRGGRHVEVRDRTPDWPMVAVQGPRALDIVQATLRQEKLLETRSENLPAQMKYYSAAILPSGKIAGSEWSILSRTGYTGEDGFELIVPCARLSSLVDALCVTASRAGTELKPSGLGARDTLRLEAAMPLYGHELSEDINPLQAGLAWAVKLKKADFVGRDALLHRPADERQRVGLELDGKRIAREGAAVLVARRPVGQVTSGTFGPTVGKAIAMAYVDPTQTSVGTVCEVDVRGKPAQARVVPLPFYARQRN